MNVTKVKPSTAQLTEVDVELLQQRDELKNELKRLDEHLRPRIEATVKAHGACRVCIGSHLVDLKEMRRLSTSWKACAYAVATEEEVNAVKGNFTLESISFDARVV